MQNYEAVSRTMMCALDLFCVALMCGLYFASMAILRPAGVRLHRRVGGIVAGYCVTLLMNDLWYISEKGNILYEYVMYVVNILYFAALCAATVLWFVHVVSRVLPGLFSKKWGRAAVLLPAALFVAAAFSTPFTHVLFYFENGEYLRGTLFWPLTVTNYLYMIAAFVISLTDIFRHRGRKLKENIVLTLYSALVLLFGLLQNVTGQNLAGIGYTSALVVYFGYVLMSSMTERNRSLEEAREELSDFRKASLVSTSISLRVNLMTGRLEYGEWKNEEGETLQPENIIGLSVPCSYDEYIKKWSEKYVDRKNAEEFLCSTDREYLRRCYEKGRNIVTFDYHAASVTGKRRYLRRVIFLIRNSKGDIIAYTTVRDISDIGAMREEQEHYIDALASDFESVDVIKFQRNKLNDLISMHHRISERFEKSMPIQWRIETNISRRLDIMRVMVVEEDKDLFYAATRREALMDAWNRGETPVVDFRIRDEKGNISFYQERFVPVRDSHWRLTGMIVCIRCTDEEIRKELGIRTELEEAKQRAEEASRAKTAFLFNMSHDIRTPMNAILGFTRIAKNHMDDLPRVTDCLDKIDASGERLLEMINDVLEMSRIESGRIDVMVTPYDLSHCLEPLEPMLNTLAASKGIQLSCHCDELRSPLVWADKVHLERILINLAGNAIKYTNEGGRVDVTVSETDKEKDGAPVFSFRVEDNGIGMSREFMDHLFEEFAREKTSTVSRQQGTGLGLSITKRISDAMGGEILVESEPGKGSVFTLLLPLRRMTETEMADSVPEQKETEASGAVLAGKRVLLAEDNALNREIALDILGDEGMETECAENGKIAVEMLAEKGADHYDFVLMDIQMPVMDGYEATRRIRDMLKGQKRLPIIAVSANAFDEDRLHSAAAGMDAHIAKPINVSELKKVLEDFI